VSVPPSFLEGVVDDAMVTDSTPGAAFDLMEPHDVPLRGRIELHGDGDHSEADQATPGRLRDEGISVVSRTSVLRLSEPQIPERHALDGSHLVESFLREPAGAEALHLRPSIPGPALEDPLPGVLTRRAEGQADRRSFRSRSAHGVLLSTSDEAPP